MDKITNPASMVNCNLPFCNILSKESEGKAMLFPKPSLWVGSRTTIVNEVVFIPPKIDVFGDFIIFRSLASNFPQYEKNSAQLLQ